MSYAQYACPPVPFSIAQIRGALPSREPTGSRRCLRWLRLTMRSIMMRPGSMRHRPSPGASVAAVVVVAVALVALGAGSALKQAAAATPTSSPAGLWKWVEYPIYYRWVATSGGFQARSMTSYKLSNGCLVRADVGVASFRYYRRSSSLYKVAYRHFAAGTGGPGPDGQNCTPSWAAPVTVKLAVRGNRMTESCKNAPAKVCYTYTRVSSVPTDDPPDPPPPPPPPVDTAKRLGQGESTTTQCGTGDNGKSVFFEGDSIGSRRQHYLDPGNTLLLPIVISGGSGGVMKWTFFSGGLGGTAYVDGCVLRYTAPTSASCSQCSPTISVEFADRTGRDVAFYARFSVTVIFTAPPSLCGREYLQVSLPRGAWFTISDGARVLGPFFEPTTFQPVATGPWRISITYAEPYRGQTREVVDTTVSSCSFAKVIRG